MADVITKTGNSFNSAELATYYDKVFLARAELSQIYNVLCSKRNVPKNSGKFLP